MKKLLTVIAIASAAAAVSASAQTTDTPAVRSGNVDSSQSFQAPIAPTPPPAPAPTPEISRERTQGVIPRALRHGRPWEMLNPGAPPQYGRAQDNVTHDPNDPGKPKGIKLFEIVF
jgi:hypothetical protein